MDNRKPSDKGWKVVVLFILLVITSILSDPCSDRNQPQTNLDTHYANN